MIYTITLNPAVDLIMQLRESPRCGMTNRAYLEKAVAGGKGINVSRVLNTMHRESTAIGFVGGFTGAFVEAELHSVGIKTDFAHLKESTRINTKLVVDNGVATEINAPSPIITREDIVNLAKKLTKVKKGDVVVISGALPKTLPMNLFENCLKVLNNKADVIIDMTGTPLLRTLKYHPLLVKPNLQELKDSLYLSVKSDDDIIKGAKRLLKMGAQNVVVSLGKDGAIFVNNEMAIHVKAPRGNVKSDIGAGDSMIAGFIDEYLKTQDIMKSFKKGIIVGSATAFSVDLATESMIKEVTKMMK